MLKHIYRNCNQQIFVFEYFLITGRWKSNRWTYWSLERRPIGALVAGDQTDGNSGRWKADRWIQCLLSTMTFSRWKYWSLESQPIEVLVAGKQTDGNTGRWKADRWIRCLFYVMAPGSFLSLCPL